MMPDLPNMGFERDIESFKEFFANPLFRTDGLKLYPTLVIRGTGLYELWKKGKYRNYPPSFLVDLIAKVLAIVPPWVRVYRVQRDIPMPLVTSGVEKGNLRNLAMQRMKDLNLVCRDVRAREVGIKEIKDKIKPENVELIRRDYYANDGWETFLSYEDPKQDILIGIVLLLENCMFMGVLSQFIREILINFNIKDMGLCLWRKRKELLKRNMARKNWRLLVELELEDIMLNLDLEMKDLIWLKIFNQIF